MKLHGINRLHKNINYHRAFAGDILTCMHIFESSLQHVQPTLIVVSRFRESVGTLNLIRPSVPLSVCHKNFNLGHNFCTITDRALIFGMCVTCDNTFPVVPYRDLDGDLWPTCLSVCHKNFNLGHNFCTITDRALILGMCVTCDNTFPVVPYRDLDGDLWPTSRSNVLPSGGPQFSEFACFYFSWKIHWS